MEACEIKIGLKSHKDHCICIRNECKYLTRFGGECATVCVDILPNIIFLVKVEELADL